MKAILTCAATLVICSVSLGSMAHAESMTFQKPKVGSQRLDLCLDWGTGCGKPAADAYCINKGFDKSTNHSVANDIGASTPTRLLKTGAVCDQNYCDGFEAITCFKPPVAQPQQQVYYKPKFQGTRLDLCVDWGVGCGKPAAVKYCQSKGWADAKGFVVANNIGQYSPTRLIGTGAVCDQGFCDGFLNITCAN